MTPLVLGVLALLLAGPAPALLARFPRTRRTPGPALVLWQACALAAVLAALGSGLSLTTSTWQGQPVVAAVALGVTVLVAVRLLVSGHVIGRELRAVRRRHRARVDLLARIDLSGVSVLDHDAAVAYCLPGRRSRIVVSAATLEALEPAQVRAVLAHERAHASARHDLLVEAFTVLHRAFPRWVSTGAALSEVRLLVEVLADRAGARAAGPRAVGEALLRLTGQPPGGPAGTLAVHGAGTELLARVQLLADPSTRRLQAGALLLVALGLIVLPTLLVAWPWISGLR